jgi:hypothetical protein
MNRSFMVAIFLASVAGSDVATGQTGAGGGPSREAGQRAQEPRSAAEFRPSVHGFLFVNRFTGSPLPAALRALKGPIGEIVREGVQEGTGAPNRFGLCGGMSLAAGDLFMARVPRPDATRPPEPGSALYEWLHQRQESSLGSGGIMALKFMSWMSMPDPIGKEGEGTDEGNAAASSGTIAHATFAELGPIVRRLEKGELVPLGLVYVRSSGNTRAPDSEAGLPWENHQVLAYRVDHEGSGAAGEQRVEGGPGMERPERDGATSGGEKPALIERDPVTLWIYDPNYPGDDGARIELSVGRDEARAVQVTGNGRRIRVRGVMSMPWTARPVPEGVAGVGEIAPKAP